MSQYVQFGILLITVPNLIVILTMIVVFAIGLVVKLPSDRHE
ncbi:MAG TPA: hypothetical protein VF812_08740 [Ktedonobacterales bacterium]